MFRPTLSFLKVIRAVIFQHALLDLDAVEILHFIHTKDLLKSIVNISNHMVIYFSVHTLSFKTSETESMFLLFN